MLDELPSEILFHILGYGCDDITSLGKFKIIIIALSESCAIY